MKNLKKIIKHTASIILALTFSTLLALPTFAAPELVLNTYDPNEIVKYLVNTIVAVLIVVGIVTGGWQLAQGFASQDPKEKTTGATLIIGSLVIGGAIIAVVNMVIA